MTSAQPIISLPVLPEEVRSPDDRFRCVPYSAVFAARVCVQRQESAKGARKQESPGEGHVGGGWKPGRLMGDYAKCRGCEVGAGIATRVGKVAAPPAREVTRLPPPRRAPAPKPRAILPPALALAPPGKARTPIPYPTAADSIRSSFSTSSEEAKEEELKPKVSESRVEYFPAEICTMSPDHRTQDAEVATEKIAAEARNTFPKEPSGDAWRPFPGFEGLYEIDANANVRSLAVGRREAQPITTRRWRAQLSKGGRQFTVSVREAMEKAWADLVDDPEADSLGGTAHYMVPEHNGSPFGAGDVGAEDPSDTPYDESEKEEVEHRSEPEASAWRPVVGYEALYEIDREGTIRRASTANTGARAGTVITARDNRGRVRLSKGGRQSALSVAMLLEQAWIAPAASSPEAPPALDKSTVVAPRPTHASTHEINEDADAVLADFYGWRAEGARLRARIDASKARLETQFEQISAALRLLRGASECPLKRDDRVRYRHDAAAPVRVLGVKRDADGAWVVVVRRADERQRVHFVEKGGYRAAEDYELVDGGRAGA